MFRGTVISGEGIGRTLGSPTANIDVTKETVHLKTGVYAAWVFLDDMRWQGALAIHDHPWKVEVYILDYADVDLYGKKISVDPVEKISEMESPLSIPDLKKKIARDIALVREVLQRT